MSRRQKVEALLNSDVPGEREAARAALGRLPEDEGPDRNKLRHAERVLTGGSANLLTEGAHANYLVQQHLRVSPSEAKSLILAVLAKRKGEALRLQKAN